MPDEIGPAVTPDYRLASRPVASMLAAFMTSKERIMRAARRQPVTPVPVAPDMGNHGARIAGVPIGRYCRSGRLMAEAQYQAWKILKLAHGRVGHRVCLMGNLDPVDVLWRGTPETVTSAAQPAIRDGGPIGFILGSGCEVAAATPKKNLVAMLAAGRSYPVP